MPFYVRQDRFGRREARCSSIFWNPTTPTDACIIWAATYLRPRCGGIRNGTVDPLAEELERPPRAQPQAGLGAQGLGGRDELGEAHPGQGLGQPPQDLVDAAGGPDGPPAREPPGARGLASPPGGAGLARRLAGRLGLRLDQSRPIDRAPSRAAALTSERTASAATAPSGWMAVRLRTSATTKQPSTRAQVISPEVGDWPRRRTFPRWSMSYSGRNW